MPRHDPQPGYRPPPHACPVSLLRLHVLLLGTSGSVPLCTCLLTCDPLPAALCFAVTRSLLLTCLVPVGLLALRYYYSRKVILAYLECALHTDMADIEQYYMKPPGSCFWVAVLDGNVVGIVAARAHEEDNTVELLRMSVDSRFRGKGIAKALGRRVLEFAMLHNYSAVVLGTTAVKVAAHKLYESLGFRHMGASDHYVLPGMTLSLAERLFFQVRYHRYRLQLREEICGFQESYCLLGSLCFRVGRVEEVVECTYSTDLVYHCLDMSRSVSGLQKSTSTDGYKKAQQDEKVPNEQVYGRYFAASSQQPALKCKAGTVQAVHVRDPPGQQETEAEASGIPAEPQQVSYR
ncbi:N-acetylaspartate synthetase-like protein [Cricetulus griseus]|nr:N-acetylaspartate synthetase-like protein [Cricetulus griseus]